MEGGEVRSIVCLIVGSSFFVFYRFVGLWWVWVFFEVLAVLGVFGAQGEN